MSHACCYGFHASVDGGLLGALQHAERHQAKAVQIFIGSTHRGLANEYHPGDLYQFKLRKQALGIKVVIHHNYITNLADPTGKLSWALSSAKRGLEVAHTLDADYFVIHNGSHNKVSMEEGLKTLRSSVEHMLQWGYKPTICMENGAGGGTQVGHLENLIRIAKDVQNPRLKVCLDTAHLWADGIDVPNGFVRKAIYQQLVPVLGMVHWNNPDPNVSCGGHLDRHKVPWDGGAWTPRVMEAIALELGGFPLIMEASGEAVDANFEYLRQQAELKKEGEVLDPKGSPELRDEVDRMRGS